MENLTKYRYYLVLTALGVIFIWSRISLPYGILFGAGHDDGWFIRQAINIAGGGWFGAYNQMTLIKGPVYPIFLAMTAVTGFSLQSTTATLHLFAACALLYSVSEHLKSIFAKYLLFILLLISQFPMQRVIRDELSLIILLFIISVFIIIFFKRKIYQSNYLSILCGLLIGLYILTREDGAWTIMPVLTFGVIVSVIRFGNRKNFKKIFSAIALIVGFAYLPNISYKFANYIKYDSFVGVELLDSEYDDALRAIYSVRENIPQRYVEITNGNLEAAFKISPTLRSLESGFQASPWREYGCQIDKSTCGQFGVGYFMWALRDAMAAQGYYFSPSRAREIYGRISLEIITACEAKQIKCANRFFSKLPGYELFQMKELVSKIGDGIKTSLSIPLIDNSTFSSNGEDLEMAARFLNISHFVFASAKSPVVFFKVSGWYYDKSDSASFFAAKILNERAHATDSNHDTMNGKIYESVAPIYLKRIASPDVASYFGDSNAKMQRFDLYLPCINTQCILEVNGHVIGDLREKVESKGYNAKGTFSIESISDVSKVHVNQTILSQQVFSIKVYNGIASVYNTLSAPLAILGIFSFAWLIFLSLRDKLIINMIAITTILWVLYAWRLLFVALMSNFFMPTGMNHLYLYPSVVILPIASLLSISALWDYWSVFFKSSVSRPNDLKL